ncbi:dienelactone hydrolase family protein [Fulvivirgaceae bacterium PWU4]|uniref:Dienelactone hydrolase family protein n=1 Tax=Chryseosolibacter histidini TaxID=2782349 RepID=A0AAP2DIH9_9BACT|nr:dienelactone hydrolase family protein [Chryseosolibacter histidini]MBT1695637.1 dienelactone hydrolase family protein [Chryseosolibacter histidini]
MNINIKLRFLFVLLSALLTAACSQEDEILPAPQESPATESAAVPVPAPVLTTKADSTKADSAAYRYATFRNMPYRILFPKNYDPAKQYPMLVFLHGIGERGSDNELQLRWGASLFQTDSLREKYPAFIVFPQCLTDHYWFDSWGTETLKGLIDSMGKEHKIGHVYIGGLSMGAYGTYAMTSRYPGFFTGAVAISGDGDSNKAPVMARARWRIFAGKKDYIVSSDKSEKMAAALRKSGASVSFTLYPGADHTGSWVNAFAEPDFVSWIFSDPK